MAAVTLAELRTRVRQRSNNEHTGSNFVTDAELNQLINYSNQELYGLLARASILNISETTQTITGTGVVNYALNDNVLMVVGVFRNDSGYNIPLERHNQRFKPHSAVTGLPTSYRATIGGIELYPAPQSGTTVSVVYIPKPVELSLDADDVDYGIGWEEFIVVDAAIRVLQKEEATEAVAQLSQERDRLIQRIVDDAAAQEMSESYTIGPTGRSYMPGDYNGVRGYRGPLNIIPAWLRY